ncbi:uncharacterized protein N0V89_008108 [Didymosphaeria variabile]|uniref:Uncharacterized protein n=1 Tax=Didymosphaeria variabile TaxID=1932322 RepID=A0A9W9C918_9PLEO|nr:uncharacterized protein N0V89_008108 [Didymosphaeria variabile]KAJ4349492.1 hypothetical protein N0V89_008108 [Didymosphaeria variabile]
MTRVLDDFVLECAGIQFDEELVTLEELKKESPQARILAQYLLDFKHIIAKERWNEVDKHTRRSVSEQEKNYIRIPEDRPDVQAAMSTKEVFEDHYNIARCDANFDIASEIKRKAEYIRSEDERRWTEVIEDTVFKRLRDKARKGESDKHRPRSDDVIKRFRVDHTWEFGGIVLSKYSRVSSFRLKAPKPDLFLSFHAYERGDTECGPLSGEDYIENFGMTCLNDLYDKYRTMVRKRPDRKFGFNPSPCKEFYIASSVKDRTCFPWAVCEWKHHGHIGTRYEDYLHCQAANAAAVCLTLFANAAAGGRASPVLGEIRPVVCMTFTGPNIKVWIAYVTEVRKAHYRYRMRCIWKGSLKNVLDNIKLCVIIENLHFWAMNHLRPWLSGCIDQWRRSTDEADKMENNRSQAAKSANKPNSGNKPHNYKPNFALRRANTLDTCLEQDSDYVPDDNSEDDSEVSGYEDGDEDGEEDPDDGENEIEDYDDDDEEQEENIDKALGQLERSLRGDKRGLEALQLLLQALCYV